MCEECKNTVLQAQTLIDAIDQNREALSNVLDKIHQDMGLKLVVLKGPNDEEPPVEESHLHFARVMLANYVAAFLAGEIHPAEVDLTDSIMNFYDTGFDHGSAYAGARQTQLN